MMLSLPTLKKRIWRRLNQPKIYILSYPKTGRTWLRSLIGKYLCEQYQLPESALLDIEYLTVAAKLPRTKFTHDLAGMQRGYHYSELSQDKTQYEKKKVILLSRDVRDVLVSAYFQATQRVHVFEGPISEFIRHEQYGAKKVLTFYKIWCQNKDVPKDFFFLRYEMIHQDPHGVLRHVLSFLELPVIQQELIETAVDYCSLEKLRKVEAEGRIADPKLQPGDINNPNSYKVRQGKVGNFNTHLSPEDVAYIDEQMAELGCEFTTYFQQ